MKFKVGDRVKFLGESCFIEEGGTGVVEEYDPTVNVHPYQVNFMRDNPMSRMLHNDVWRCSEHELELVE